MEHEILILFYNTMFGVPLEYSPQELPARCRITTDRSFFHRADAVIFHIPDLWRILTGNEEIEKQEGQLWVAWSLECEENYPWTLNCEFCDLFDLWMGYHEKDDILYSYCEYHYLDKLKEPLPQLPRKNKICMFISSNFNLSHRQQYLYELAGHIAIDSYGSFLRNQTLPSDQGTESLLDTIREYKFTIAFENATAPDYVTEKFFNPFIAGSVPIYFGAPNIRDFMPGENCFVDVRSYANPLELAQFINRCYDDESLYSQFFEWKKDPLRQEFIERMGRERVNPIIRLCAKVKELKNK